MSVTHFLEKSGDSLVAKDDFEIYIERENLGTNIAKDVDDKLEVFGIFKLKHKGKSYKCRLPLVIQLNVFKRDVKDGYVILSYTKNDRVVNSMGFFPGVKHANVFVDLLIGGKFDSLTPIEFANMLKGNLDLNKTRTGIPVELIEAMASELYRSAENDAIPYRLSEGGEPRLLSIKDVARVSSVFGAISFENVKTALQSAVKISSQKGHAQAVSPVEYNIFHA